MHDKECLVLAGKARMQVVEEQRDDLQKQFRDYQIEVCIAYLRRSQLVGARLRGYVDTNKLTPPG